MIRRTCAPILVCRWTFQRKMSPTLTCTRSKSAASSWLWVPLPLPWTPMITYLRMASAWHTQRPVGTISTARTAGAAEPELALAGPPHPAADHLAQLRPVLTQAARGDEAGQGVSAGL